MCCVTESELPLFLSSLEHMRTAGETVEFFFCVCRTNDWIKSSPVESVCKYYTSHMSEPKLPARALHETGTPQRSARLPRSYWTPAGGRRADRLKPSSAYQTVCCHHTSSTLWKWWWRNFGIVDKTQWKSAPFWLCASRRPAVASQEGQIGISGSA